MFKVLKGPRGNGNICMLMRVVTDFNIFDIGILQIFVFVFFFILAFLRVIILVLICSITLHQYQQHNFNIRLSAHDFCMPASLMFNLTMTACWPLYSTSSKQSLRSMCFNATISNYHKPLYSTIQGF